MRIISLPFLLPLAPLRAGKSPAENVVRELHNVKHHSARASHLERLIRAADLDIKALDELAAVIAELKEAQTKKEQELLATQKNAKEASERRQAGAGLENTRRSWRGHGLPNTGRSHPDRQAYNTRAPMARPPLDNLE